MKEFSLGQERYPLTKVDGGKESEDPRDRAYMMIESQQEREKYELSTLMRVAERPRSVYDTTVALLSLHEDASSSELQEIFVHLNERFGYCRPMSANELYSFANQHRRLDIGRNIFAVGSAVQRMYTGDRCDPSWVLWESRSEQRAGQLFSYELTINPSSTNWTAERCFKAAANQFIPIIVTKPSPLVGADRGTFCLG